MANLVELKTAALGTGLIYCHLLETGHQISRIVQAMFYELTGMLCCLQVSCQIRTADIAITYFLGELPGSRMQGTGSQRISGPFQWQLPFGAFSASSWAALVASRYMHEFGATREQLAQIALNARSNAMLNERAVYRDPLTMEDYLASRMISDPLCLFDCDVPIDGSTVIIISHKDCVPDLKSKAIHIEAIGGPLYGRDSWDQQDDLTRFGAEDAGKMLWSRTDFKPKDVDFAELYDGFSFLTLLWLEGLGFCGRGEAAAFVEGGQRIGRDGELPLASHGGQLSAGRTHGLGYFHEAVKQLRGEAGSHQLSGDRKLAVVSNGGGNLSGAALLRSD